MEQETVSPGLHERLSARIRRQGKPAIRLVSRYLVPLLRPGVPLVRLHGPAPGLERSATVLVAGSGAAIDYLTHRFFAAAAERESLGSVPLPLLPRRLAREASGHDLVLARVERPAARWLFGDDYLRVPESVDARLDVRAGLDALARRSNSVRSNIRTVRKNQLTWSLSRDPADFDLFYESFYRPYTLARFGPEAQVRARGPLRQVFRNGGIQWIWQGGRRIGASLFEVNGRALRGVANGVASDEGRTLGALSATYLFNAELAHRNGLDWVELGGCLPSLRDGVLMHKRNWGAVITDRRHSDHDLLVHWPALAAPVTRLLAEVPLIFRDQGGLAALGVHPAHEPADAEEALVLWKQLMPEGLLRLYVAAPAGWRAPERDPGERPGGAVWLAGPGLTRQVLAGALSHSEHARRRGAAPDRTAPATGSPGGWAAESYKAAGARG